MLAVRAHDDERDVRVIVQLCAYMRARVHWGSHPGGRAR